MTQNTHFPTDWFDVKTKTVLIFCRTFILGIKIRNARPLSLVVAGRLAVESLQRAAAGSLNDESISIFLLSIIDKWPYSLARWKYTIVRAPRTICDLELLKGGF